MAGKLSFSIAINLLTENFKRGTNQVKAAFRSMQAQILTFAAALGAGGIGLSNLATRFVEVARETSRVTTSLKNVSGSMSQYADNQKYLLDIAKKYGLEINALTGNFAKFTAAASISGMSMENQRKIFESVSRACTAFGMNADDSNGVMLALSQMMSKGKISSEELRLQMGERLPVALQAMAKAAGVSVAGLDKLLKQGKLMSADVLPKFANALNEMIPNVDTDNLETSVNRLKNIFTEVVNSSGVQGSYKALIDWLTGAIQTAAENIKNIVIGVIALITGMVANGAVKWWVSISGTARQLEAAAIRSNSTLIAATQQRIAAEIALEKAKVAANNATGAAALAAQRQVIQAQNALVAASAAEQVEIENVKAAELRILDAKKLADAKTTAAALAAITRKRVAAEIELEAAKNGVITANSAGILAAQQRLAASQTNLAKLTAREVVAAEAAKAAAAEAVAVQSQGAWVRFCNTTKAAVGKLVVSLRTLWSTFAPMAIVSALIWIVAKFSSVRKEAEEIAAIYSSFKNGAKSASNTQEIIQLRVLQDLYNKAVEGSKLKEKYQNRINELLGGEIKKNQDINGVIRERIKLLEATAKTEYYTQKKISSQDELNQIYGKYGGVEGYEKAARKQAEFEAKRHKLDKWANDFNSVTQDRNKVDQLIKIIDESDKEIRANTEYVIKKTPVKPIIDLDGDPDENKKKKKPLQKQQESYFKQYEELGAELGIGKITQVEYNKALGELNIKMYAQAKGTGDKEVLESEYLKQRKIAAEKAVAGMEHTDAMVELEKVQKDYNSKIKEVNQQYDKHLISQEELNKNIVSLSVDASKSAAGIKGIGTSADGFITAMQFNAQTFASPIKVKPRDATFDYKKTDIDIASENLDKAKELADAYKQHAEEIGNELSNELANAMANVPSMEQALKIAQVKQDIKDLSKEIGNMKWDGIKSAVASVDGIASAFERLKEAFDPDSEADGWERLMALWNSMTSVIDGIMSVIETIKNITELTNKLTEAKQTEQVIDEAATASKVTNKATETTAEIAAITAKTTAETTALATQATASVAASTAKTTADTIAMAAASTAAYASIPFAGPVLAAAQIATMKGMIMAAAIPFAKGGIISHGPTSGDRILARVNAGEMILNGSQQSNLFDAINSGNLGSGKTLSSTVTTKVRSKDLILTINNELKSQGKKPIS